MTGWGGEVADRHVRLVFSAEPVERLRTILAGSRGHGDLQELAAQRRARSARPSAATTPTPSRRTIRSHQAP